MSRNRKYSPIPTPIKAILLDGIIGKTFCRSQPNTIIGDNQAEELKKAPFEENDDIQIIQTNIRTKAQLIQNEWIHLASIIDRIAFVIYVIIFILMGFIHFI